MVGQFAAAADACGFHGSWLDAADHFLVVGIAMGTSPYCLEESWVRQTGGRTGKNHRGRVALFSHRHFQDYVP